MEREVAIRLATLSNPSSEWQHRAASLHALRQLAETGDTNVNSPLRQALPALSSHLAAAVADLRSSLVREGCACIAAFSTAFGTDFCVATGDTLIPALLRASIVTIAVIASSAQESLRMMLTHGAAGISAKTASYLADIVIVRDERSHHAARAAAMTSIGYLLVEEFLTTQPQRTLAAIGKAIQVGCTDPSATVRDRSRGNWRRLELVSPVRAGDLLDQIPEHIQALILQEKSYEFAAAYSTIKDNAKSGNISQNNKAPSHLSDIASASGGNPNEKPGLSVARRGPRRASLASPGTLLPAMLGDSSMVHGDAVNIQDTELAPKTVRASRSPPFQSGDLRSDLLARPAVSRHQDGDQKPPSVPRRALPTSPSSRPPLFDESLAQVKHPFDKEDRRGKTRVSYRGEPNPFARRPPRRSVAIGMTGPLFRPQNLPANIHGTPKSNGPVSLNQSKSFSRERTESTSPCKELSASEASKSITSTPLLVEASDCRITSTANVVNDRSNFGDTSSESTRESKKDAEHENVDKITAISIENENEYTSISANDPKLEHCIDTHSPLPVAEDSPISSFDPSRESASQSRSPNPILLSNANVPDADDSSLVSEQLAELSAAYEAPSKYALDDTTIVAEGTRKDGDKTMSLQQDINHTIEADAAAHKVLLVERSSTDFTTRLGESKFPPTPEAVRIAARKSRISFILNANEYPQRTHSSSKKQIFGNHRTVQGSTDQVSQACDRKRSLGSPDTKVFQDTPSLTSLQIQDDRDRDAVNALLNIAEQPLPTEQPQNSPHSPANCSSDSSKTAFTEELDEFRDTLSLVGKENLYTNAPIATTNSDKSSSPENATGNPMNRNKFQGLPVASSEGFRLKEQKGTGFSRSSNFAKETNRRQKPSSSAKGKTVPNIAAANKSPDLPTTENKLSLTKMLIDGSKLIETSKRKSWEMRVEALKRFQEALQTCAQHPKFRSCEVINSKLATKIVGLLCEMASDAHNRVVSAALDAFFFLLLCVEVPSCDSKDANPLQIALERRPDAMLRILTLSVDTKENTRLAATRVMQSMIVQFRPEVRVLLIIQAMSSARPPRGNEMAGGHIGRGISTQSPKSSVVGCEQLVEAFRSASASGEGFAWQPVSLLRSLLIAMASLLLDRRAIVRAAAGPVVQAAHDSLPPGAMDLALSDSRFKPTEVKVLRGAFVENI